MYIFSFGCQMLNSYQLHALDLWWKMMLQNYRTNKSRLVAMFAIRFMSKHCFEEKMLYLLFAERIYFCPIHRINNRNEKTHIMIQRVSKETWICRYLLLIVFQCIFTGIWRGDKYSVKIKTCQPFSSHCRIIFQYDFTFEWIKPWIYSWKM